MERTIICFANSRKWHERCIAGKDIETKEWIRPVTSTEKGSIYECSRCLNTECNNRKKNIFTPLNCNKIIEPKLLDIIKIPLKKYLPKQHQQENYLIDENKRFKKVSNALKEKINLYKYLDEYPGELWVDGYSSSKGENDRIPVNEIHKVNSSLLLLKPDKIKIKIEYNTQKSKKEIRGIVRFDKMIYILKITDPVIEKKLEKYQHGTYACKKNIILCISLGEEFKGYYYKLIAGINVLN